ncbi:hypothetical protein V8G54_003263 [Vigna mungo]|uniref:Uncharacterized protein n=1 Tax=Vigna mungo TaxID=3915 RepID=A0AAQ3PAN1_VIGMU
MLCWWCIYDDNHGIDDAPGYDIGLQTEAYTGEVEAVSTIRISSLRIEALSGLPPTPIASTTTDLPFTSLPSNRRERDEEKGQQREAFPVQYISEGQNPKIGSLTVCSSNNPDAGSTPNHFNSSVEPHSVPYRGESPLQFCNKKQYFKIKQKDRKLTPKVLAPLQSFKLLSIQIKSNPPHASIRKQKRKGDRGGVEEGEGFGGG